MKIVFTTDQIYMHGGIEKVMATKVNYWANLPDVEVYIITTEQIGKKPCYQIDARVKLIDLGINYNRSQSYFSKTNIKKAVLHVQRQNKLFAELQPDVVISPNFNFDHYWLPFIKRGSKLIKERHSSRYLEPQQRENASILLKVKFKITDWIESKYNHIVVLNQDEAEYVKTDNAVVIPNPIKLTNLQADFKNKLVMAAGRIAPVKGFDQLIEAWAIVYQNAPEWQLHIYGDNYGDTQQQLQQLIDQHQLQEVVHFMGVVDDLSEKMVDYNIFALSSVTECFPTVVLESLNVGLPVVAYDCPNGPRNIITNNKDGLLAENQKPSSLATKLLELITNANKQKEFGTQAKENSLRFSIQNVMRQWNKLLNLE